MKKIVISNMNFEIGLEKENKKEKIEMLNKNLVKKATGIVAGAGASMIVNLGINHICDARALGLVNRVIFEAGKFGLSAVAAKAVNEYTDDLVDEVYEIVEAIEQ